MQAAVPEGKGAMLAVMGLENDTLISLIKKFDIKKGTCEIANDNSPGQIILSGTKDTLVAFSNHLKVEKKKINISTCQCPFPLFPNETSC